MADNVIADAGSGGATFRTDDDGTAHWPYTKIAFGPDNTQTIVASTATNPFPVALSDTDNAVLDTIDAVLDTINAKLVTGTIIGDVNANAGTNLNTSALLTSTNFSDVLGTATLVTTAQADALANTLDSVNVTAFSYVFNGTTWDRVREGSTAGSVLVDLGSNNNVTIDSGTVTTVSTVTNLAQMGGVAISLNTGVRDTGTQRVTIATNDLVPVTGTITAVTSITNDVSIDDGGNAITVDWAGTAPPIGAGTEATALRVTVATDSTGVLSVDDNGGSLTVDSGAAFTVQEDGAALTALQLIDNVVVTLGTDTYTEATTSANVIGVVRKDSGATLVNTDNEITALQVDASGSLRVTGGGGGTEYTEDVVTPADPVGGAVMLRREDAPVSVAADADWIAQNSTQYGAAYVQILDSSGNFINTFGGSGGTSATDDTAFTAGSGTGTPAMGFFSTDTVDSGDAGVLAMDASRRLMVSIEVDNVGIGGGIQYTEAATDATITGTVLMMEDSADTIRAATGNVANGLDVDVTRVQGTVTVDNAGTFVVQEDGAALTALQLIDNAVSGAGFNITQLGGVNVTMGNGASGTGVQRVTIASDTTGVLSVDDNGGALTVDWAGAAPPIGAGTEAAALRVTLATDSTGVVTVDNAGTFTVQEDGAALTALQLIDDIVYTDDTSTHATGTSKGAGMMAAATPTDGSIDANDIGMLAMSLDRRLHVDADITASVALDVSAATITVAAHAVTNAGTFVVQEDGAALTALQLIDNAVSGAGFNITQMNGVNLTMDSGVAGTGVQRVSVATDDVVTVDLAGNNDVQGDIAHDAINSGNPFQLGAEAIAHGTNPTAVAAADRTRLYSNRAGIPFMIGGHPNVVTKSARNTAAQTDTALVTVAGGLKIVVTRVSITVDNSCTVDVDFECGFGTATVPTAATGAGVAGMLADFMGVAAGGGITIGDGSGILGVGADGEDLRYSNTVPTTGNCTVTVSYYTIES